MFLNFQRQRARKKIEFSDIQLKMAASFNNNAYHYFRTWYVFHCRDRIHMGKISWYFRRTSTGICTPLENVQQLQLQLMRSWLLGIHFNIIRHIFKKFVLQMLWRYFLWIKPKYLRIKRFYEVITVHKFYHRCLIESQINICIHLLKCCYDYKFFLPTLPLHKWNNVFKSGPNKICERESLKNLKWYGLFKQTISIRIFQKLSSTNLRIKRFYEVITVRKFYQRCLIESQINIWIHLKCCYDYKFFLPTLPLHKWNNVFKSGPNKICERESLKNLKWYGLFKQTISIRIFQRLSSTNYLIHSRIYCPKYHTRSNKISLYL